MNALAPLTSVILVLVLGLENLYINVGFHVEQEKGSLLLDKCLSTAHIYYFGKPSRLPDACRKTWRSSGQSLSL